MAQAIPLSRTARGTHPLITNKEHALRYYDAGWSVRPFHSPLSDGSCSCEYSAACDRIGKHERDLSQIDHADDERDPREWFRELIEKAFDRWPDANIGIMTGKASGLVVLDVSAERGGLAVLDDLQSRHGVLPLSTPSVATGGGGVHYYFAAPPVERPRVPGLAQGLTYLGDGDFVIAPPSKHASGMTYEWNIDPGELPPAPIWLDEMVIERLERVEKTTTAPEEIEGFTISVDEWDGATPDAVEAAVDDNQRVRQLFRRDKRLKVEGGSPDKTDFGLAIALCQWGIMDPRTIAFGLMASRHRDPDAWYAIKNRGGDYFSRTVITAMRRVREQRADAAEAEASTHPALRNREFPWNEKGNADRFLAIHGEDLIFHTSQKAWYVWDGQYFSDGLSDGNRRGGNAGVEIRSQRFLDDLWALPQCIENEDDRKAAEKWVKRSGTSGMMASIITLAKAHCAASERDLDPDPYVLNCRNGIVNLRTGEIEPHDRKHRCTRIAGAPYDENVLCQEFVDTLEAAIPDREVRNYFQKCMGYSLLGVQPEQVFFFVYGPGATGKSTIIKAIQGALGSYHKAADFSTFLQQQGRSGGGGAASPDLARLARVRVVSSTEVGHGQALNDGLIKQLSGGDTMVARGLFESVQEWTPVMGLWFVANDRPRGRVDDDALWRRLRPFEFAHKVDTSEMDPLLGAKLSTLEARTGILAWLVMGAMEYLGDGHLRPPAAVIEGVESYRASSNPLSEFYEDACRFDEDAWIERGALWEAYRKWCRENDVRGLGKKKFYSVVDSDYPIRKTGGIRIADGIALTTVDFDGGTEKAEGDSTQGGLL